MFWLLTVRLQITRFVGWVLKNHISFRVLTKKWLIYCLLFFWLLKYYWTNHLIVTETNKDNVRLVYPHLPDGEIVSNIRNRRPIGWKRLIAMSQMCVKPLPSSWACLWCGKASSPHRSTSPRGGRCPASWSPWEYLQIFCKAEFQQEPKYLKS